jgi:hypothetical protein
MVLFEIALQQRARPVAGGFEKNRFGNLNV